MKNLIQFKLKNIQLIHPWKFFPIKSSWRTALEDMWKLQVSEKYYRVLNEHRPYWINTTLILHTFIFNYEYLNVFPHKA